MKILAGEIPLTLVGEPRAWIVASILGLRQQLSHEHPSSRFGAKTHIL